ncbi:glycine--tRNA ligase subunit beta [Facklamia hominis]|uniref:glycine--tRNA ligase subunit beta n=1 Tax=Facklamia hominis TaxID=178214 RepID=UPI000354498D|nr:glycine--tRNA ligase subunit beta [Facklamia hominis]EPH12876.1 glycine-tRNA ligase, beta subunit [Facklamia hominis ACS-120-V-Sch10]RYC98980.1 glycine--tRNA ligase subunit beta [Facklamia hominis]
MAQYLFELGLEEIPARFLIALRDQLADRFADFLQHERLDYESIESFATPRRLAIRVNGLSDFQNAQIEEVRGPSLKAGRDETGQLTKAGQGFLRGQQGLEADLFVKEVKGTEYLFLKKTAAQVSAAEVLKKMGDLVAQLHFPVTMRWSDLNIEYIRPVHWMVSLLDEEVIPFEFAGVTANQWTRGHRFLKTQDQVIIKHPKQYESVLKDQFVIVSFEERMSIIRQQINEIAQEKHWLVPENQDLLEEVTAIVEWPTAFNGTFESEYLELPQAVLVTAMRDHQRYFYCLDENTEKLLPYFISVRNGNDQHLDQVIKGNEKVLRARLSDAMFFYQEDLKHDLDHYLEGLTRLNEHYKLGSYADKQVRVYQLLQLLASRLKVSEQVQKDALRAAQIYKFDLMTLMVDEFSELQGVMGGFYAQKYGESSSVAQAISEQYLPTSANGELPQSQVGALLALADKLDTLASFFSVGLIPTGSNDPYALRRQAMGIIEICLDQDWPVDFSDILLSYLQQSTIELRQEILNFLKARVQVLLENQTIDYDVIQASLNKKHLVPLRIVGVAKLVQAFKEQHPDQFHQMVENLSRVVNLGTKVGEEDQLESNLAQSDLEAQFIQKVMDLKHISGLNDRLQAYQDLSPIIAHYFEDHMINDEDPKVRHNRYQLMRELTQLILSNFDPRLIVD